MIYIKNESNKTKKEKGRERKGVRGDERGKTIPIG